MSRPIYRRNNVLAVAALIFCSHASAAVPTATVAHTFRYVPPVGAATVPVSVAGDFNGWSATPNPMTRGADGTYSVTVDVPPGAHQYKIVYDGKWIADPANHDVALETPDPNGGKNSGFVAGPAGAAPSPPAAVAAGLPTHTFRYVPPAGAATVPVSVAGDFNGWSATPNPMVRAADGSYAVTVAVPPGVHQYKIVYDGKWIADPANHDVALETPDPNGGKNSGFTVAAPPAAAVPPGSRTHTFRYVPAAGSPTVPVSVAGDFNGWSAAANPMPRGADGTYSATVPVPPGVHQYKVVVDGKWIADPANHDKSLETPDPNGGQNSGFDAGGTAPPAPHAAGPVPAGSTNVTLRFTPPAGAPTVPVSVAADFNGWSAVPNPMTRAEDGSYWLTIAVPNGLHHYKVVYNGKWIANPSGDKDLETDDGVRRAE